MTGAASSFCTTAPSAVKARGCSEEILVFPRDREAGDCRYQRTGGWPWLGHRSLLRSAAGLRRKPLQRHIRAARVDCRVWNGLDVASDRWNRKRARPAVFSARTIDAAEAQRMGLVNRDFPQEPFSKKNQESLRIIKRQVYGTPTVNTFKSADSGQAQ
jgi:hypothetical protein